MGKKLTTAEFILGCTLQHYGYYSYDKVVYTSNKCVITIGCPVHGDFRQQAGKHKNRGDNCPKCAYNMRAAKNAMTVEEFIKRATEVHGSKFSYVSTVYKNSTTVVDITCKLHGTFSILPLNHITQHQGCPTCGIIATGIANTSTLEEFICKARNTHGDFYSYTKAVYVNSITPLLVTCPTHGDFLQKPTHHYFQGSGCPSCNTAYGGFKPYKPGTLYYLSINNGQAYKIGITNKTVAARFSIHEMQSIRVLATWDFNIGRDAHMKEQEILKKYKSFQYTGDDLIKIGNTELFTKDVLQLDKEIQ